MFYKKADLTTFALITGKHFLIVLMAVMGGGGFRPATLLKRGFFVINAKFLRPSYIQ